MFLELIYILWMFAGCQPRHGTYVYERTASYFLFYCTLCIQNPPNFC
jgi:hypothetical protein